MQAVRRNGVIWAIQDTKDLFLGRMNASVRIYKYDGINDTVIRSRESAGKDYSFGGIAVNQNNQALITFNSSSPSDFISIRYADFDSDSVEVKSGEAIAMTGRWGDYALITTDFNNIDFWMVHIYAKANGGVGIWISSTALPNHIVRLPLLIK